MARPTIADVARVAGVSESTVSRVLNESEQYIRRDTRERVLQAVRALGYRPSRLARSLILQRTQCIGLLISDISDPFYAEMILGVERVSLAYDYDLFLCNTMYDPARGMRFVQSLIDKHVDGVLLMTTSLSDSFVSELAAHEIPYVALDWPANAVSGRAGVVTTDFEAGIYQAVDHLVQLGHTRFAHINGPSHLRTSHRKQRAFLDALARHGLDGAAVVITAKNMQIHEGKQALAALLAQPGERPSAVLAANDMLAIGVIWAAREHGLDLPHDLSVVGFGDMPLASQISLPLTTIALERYATGERMMTMLLHLMDLPADGITNQVVAETVHTQLVTRMSTGPPGLAVSGRSLGRSPHLAD